jgi:hypothetical protein
MRGGGWRTKIECCISIYEAQRWMRIFSICYYIYGQTISLKKNKGKKIHDLFIQCCTIVDYYMQMPSFFHFYQFSFVGDDYEQIMI